jgi:alpha-mannosidase
MDLDAHTGTLTSSAKSKKYNKICENKLHTLEWLMTMSDCDCSKDRLDDIWKEILLYQFHDIITGTSIFRVFEESWKAYEKIIAELDQYIDSCAKNIASIKYGDGAVVVYNSSPFENKQYIQYNDEWQEVTVSPYSFSELKGNKLGNTNFQYSEESIEKMKTKLKGRVPWNKGKTGSQVAWNKGLKLKTT